MIDGLLGLLFIILILTSVWWYYNMLPKTGQGENISILQPIPAAVTAIETA